MSKWRTNSWRSKGRDTVAQPQKKGNGVHTWNTVKLSIPHTRARHLQATLVALCGDHSTSGSAEDGWDFLKLVAGRHHRDWETDMGSFKCAFQPFIISHVTQWTSKCNFITNYCKFKKIRRSCDHLKSKEIFYKTCRVLIYKAVTIFKTY